MIRKNKVFYHRIIFIGLLIGIIFPGFKLLAQSWNYELGTSAGIHNSGTSTSFLPDPSSGNDFVRVGSGGGAISLENPGSAKIGTFSELVIKASSSTSYNKMSIYDYDPGTSFYIRFSFLLGDSAGGISATDGTVTFIQGDGANFSNSSNYSSAQTFTGIRWYFGSNGSIGSRYLNGGSWNTISGANIMQGNVYTIEIFGNNSSSIITYDYNGINCSVDSNSQDIILNGQLIANDFGCSNLSAGSPIDSWMFIAGSSSSNRGHIFIDDITYNNTIVSNYETQIHYYASATGFLDSLSTWKSNKDGTGNLSPLSFNESYVSFHIQNNSNPIISGDWNVSGISSEAILGNGLDNCVFSTGAYNIDVNNLLINSRSQLFVVGGQRVTVSGDVYLDDTNCIYLQSPVGSGAVGSFICDGMVGGSGSVTVEQYLEPFTSSVNGWHLLASPVTNQPVFNDATDMYCFDETKNTWINFNCGSFSDTTFIPGKGYLVAYSSGTTKRFSGFPNNENLILNMLSSPALTLTHGQGNGWNLAGNPYPAAIDWDLIGKTDIDGAVYIWNGVQYDSWNGSVGNISNGIIPAMQGFFIKVNGNNPQLEIEKSDRVHAPQSFYKKNPNNLLELFAEGNGLRDNLFIHFRNDASKGFDKDYDAYKLYGRSEAPQIYSEIQGDTILSTSSLPFSSVDTIIQIGFEIGIQGLCNITAKGISDFKNSAIFILEDIKTGIHQNLNINPLYEFFSYPDDKPQRFRLHYSIIDEIHENEQVELSLRSENGKILIKCDKFIEEVSIFDLTGKQVNHLQINKQNVLEIDMKTHRSGLYLLHVRAENQCIAGKVLLINE